MHFITSAGFSFKEVCRSISPYVLVLSLLSVIGHTAYHLMIEKSPVELVIIEAARDVNWAEPDEECMESHYFHHSEDLLITAKNR